MKKLTTTLIGLSLAVVLFAQTPGTLDTNFGDNGIYTVQIPGSAAWLNFLSYEPSKGGDEGYWALMAGGDIRTNFQSDGLFQLELSEQADPVFWRGYPSTDLQAFSDVVYLPDGSFLAGGSGMWQGTTWAKLVKFAALGEMDMSWGNNGAFEFNQNPIHDYVNHLYYDRSDPDNPAIYAAGSSYVTANEQKPAIWKINGSGTALDTDWGNDGLFMPDYADAAAWINDMLVYDDHVYAAGAVGYRGFFTDISLLNNEYQGFLNTQDMDPNNFYEYFSLMRINNWFLLSGYHYDTESNLSYGLVDQFTRNTPIEPGYSIETEASMKAVGTLFNGRVTGVQEIMPAPVKPGGTKTDNSSSPLIWVGSIMLNEDIEATFVAAIGTDGTLDETFGQGGGTLIQFGTSSWPKDVQLVEDGSLYIGINENGKAHIVKLHPYYDLSGVEDPNLLDESISLFPNPVQETLKIQVQLTEGQVIEWQINNLLGQQLMSGHTQNYPAGKQEINLSVKDLPAGQYILTTNLKTGHSIKFQVR